MECPNCNKLMWSTLHDGGTEEWYCHDCGETFIGSGDWPMPEGHDEADIYAWSHAPDEDYAPPTPRQRIERAVASVCEAAASIRAKLARKDELPF